MEHATFLPISPSRAAHRPPLRDVPFMHRKSEPAGSTSSAGTGPPEAGSASDQWKDTR